MPKGRRGRRDEAEHPGHEVRHLTRGEVREVLREIEREERFRLARAPSVRYASRMESTSDFARFHASLNKRGTNVTRAEITLFEGQPVELQRVALRHELRELIGSVKLGSVPRAHERAMRLERDDIQKVPHRTSGGRKYTRTMPLFRRFQVGGMRPERRAPRRAGGGWLSTVGRWLGLGE